MRIIRGKELAVMLNLSPTTIWRMRRSGLLPEPKSISVRAVGWDLAVIEAWIESRKVAGVGSEVAR